MKYCMECGTKVEGSLGQPAKFCANCGTSIGGTASVPRRTTEETSKINVPEIKPEEAFEIEGGDPDVVSFKFENLLGTSDKQSKGAKLRREGGAKDINALKARMKSKEAIDA
jgi:hypothetical protein